MAKFCLTTNLMLSTQSSLLHHLKHSKLGDQEGWTRFVKIYTPLCFEFARRLGIPESEQPDVVQEMMVRVLRGIGSFERRSDGSFRGWLFRLLKNAWIDWLRRNAPSLQVADKQVFEASQADPLKLIAEQEYRQYMLRRVHELVLAEFPTSNQVVFQHVVIDQHPPEEVAKTLGVSLNAIYLIRSRMLRRIRDALVDLVDDG
jgi:RNA polymerase sigma-70 factor, ECF subfamily